MDRNDEMAAVFSAAAKGLRESVNGPDDMQYPNGYMRQLPSNYTTIMAFSQMMESIAAVYRAAGSAEKPSP